MKEYLIGFAVLSMPLLVTLAIGRLVWRKHTRQQARHSDKHDLLVLYLRNRDIMETAGAEGVVSRQAHRNLLGNLGNMQEEHVDILLARFYANRNVRKAISRYVFKTTGQPRLEHEKKMLRFAERVNAGRDAAERALKVGKV